MNRIKHWRNIAALTAVYILILSVFYLLDIPCLFKQFFSIECPGCGMSRALLAVIRLDFAAAFAYHPMFWSVPVLYLYLLFNGKLFNKKIIDYTVLILIALGFIINWVAKFV